MYFKNYCNYLAICTLFAKCNLFYHMQCTVLAGSARKKESAPLFTKTPLNSNIKTSVNPYRPLNSKKFPPFSSAQKHIK